MASRNDMTNRTVTHLPYAHSRDMDDFPIRQPFPTNNVQQVDPFLLLHHADIKVPRHLKPAHADVGPYPHRGFCPVTFVFKGAVHHRDSSGNSSVVYGGGAQWMNAGMGVIHSERPSDDIHTIGGKQEISLPAKNKMDQPAYLPVKAEDTPQHKSDDGLVTINVVSGEVLGVKGPVTPATPVNAATVEARRGGKISIRVPHDFNALLYLLDGKITVDGYGLTGGLHAIVFGRDGEGISFEALEDTRLLLLSGKPVGEEVVSHGPFVMNTQTQILKAMRDYQMGKMGILIEE